MRLALVTGATGFIGQRVVVELVDHGWEVRCLCRSRDKAMAMPWADRVESGEVEIVEGDAGERADVERALDGVDCAWYLLHSMSSGSGFAEQEAAMARQFGEVAAEKSVSRIVYLGGLHPEGPEAEGMSEHLASRGRVGEELRAAGVPTAALQAGVVIGDGSLSFELLRHVSERVPAFAAPRWITNRITPISVRDAVHYLVAAADLPPEHDRAFDIGGPDTMPYVDMMQRYTQVVGVNRRPFLAAPIMTRRLASFGLSLLTPLSMREILPIFDSVSSDTVLKERDLEALVGTPEGGNQTFDEAVAVAAQGTNPGRYGKIATTVHLAVLATAIAGSLLTDPDSRRYKRLRKPSWQPPAAAFPLVWTLLYVDLAVISSTTIADSLEAGEPAAARADAAALAGNLVLNAGWSGVFFRSHRRGVAAAWAAALTASSADLVRRAYRRSPTRAALLAPYPLWCAFATALTARIARLNRS
ncbi:Tryptophan-rich sensory protein (benzodiazepine receptor homolog) [Corynebacterium mycetoides]|uniref:Tryptophan-rich sensory protein (Benzodiazepine receptor homolog) n=1 Tax=Corynebacterium mycetoides TaxID=38302 RepID=A0A1G9LJL8_9CORY|nr:SDR family NAD(P)-dependent oxidoreductase [Corynebacterium mycetoides]SDL62048.1 Tryptophan-rich sensory protein (benzodiazepine receptor homolog) [Corynebacterium mycetoides]